jgi:CRISPR-associated endoribonuclease Cas6
VFLSAILPLTALNSLERDAFLGREAHALFLGLVQGASPALAENLHADEQRKPFTVSGLRRARTPSSTEKTAAPIGQVEQGEAYSLRFTSLSEDLSAVLLESVLPHLPETIRLGDALFQTAAPITQAQLHPWAGQSSAEELQSKWFAPSHAPPRQLELEFASPTMIKQRGRFLVMPTPMTIFQSYLMAWNVYAAPAFEDDLLALVERDVLVTRYHLRTRALQLRSVSNESEGKHASSQIGFLGRCAFTCFSPERALWRTLHLLADFAFFCGTGYKTTQGMGQTRRVARDEEQEKRGESSKGD